jgi:hypothetical protein
MTLINHLEKNPYLKYVLYLFFLLFIFLSKDYNNNPVVTGLLALTACSCFFILKENSPLTKYIWVIYLFLFAVVFYRFSNQVIFRMGHPAIWDYTAYYLYGKVAAEGLNFYNPDNYRLVFDSLNLPFTDFGDFVVEVVDVGCPYPPPTILYLLPIGHMSYDAGLIYWSLFHLAFALGCIYLIYDSFLKSYKLNGLFLVAILFFLLKPVLSTVFFSQTNFVVLFLILLTHKYSDKKLGGVFLAIAIFTKPYTAIFGLFFLITRRWKIVFSAIISGIALLLITFLIVGPEPFDTYFFHLPIDRAPLFVFSESINQSLHAVLLRANLITLENPFVYMFIFGTILLAGIGITIFLVKKKHYNAMFIILLLVALLIYPGTLSYYGTVLLFVLFLFLSDKADVRISPYYSIPVIAAVYCLTTFSVFSAICFLLIFFLARIFIPENLALKLKLL